MHHNRYLAHQLLDYPTQRLEAVDGEEEAEYGDYVAKKRRNNGQPDGARMRVQSMSLPARQQSVQQPSGGRTKQTARIASQGAGLFGAAAPNQRAGGGYASAEVDEGIEDDRDSYDRDDEDYRRQSKKPMEAKQGLLHLLSTEIVLNTRLHGELTCFSTTFDSWNPLLPHQTIYTVLDFLGVSDRWKKFFERYLQAPLKFNDDPSAEPRLRRRGMPGSHALSDTLGEAVLFCMDYAANQAASGPDLYRLGDNAWFWHRDYNTCAKAWASIVKFTEVTGTKVGLLIKSTHVDSTDDNYSLTTRRQAVFASHATPMLRLTISSRKVRFDGDFCSLTQRVASSRSIRRWSMVMWKSYARNCKES